MKLFCAQHKKLLLSITAILLIAVSALAGACIGIQYFYDEFVAAKAQFKATFGIVSATDAALIAEEEAAAEAASYLRIVTINGNDTTIDLNAENFTWFDTTQMMTDAPNTFIFHDFASSGYDVYFEGQQVTDGETITLTLESLGLVEGLALTLIDQQTGDTIYYYIRTLHSSFNIATYIAQDEIEEGYYYFTSANTLYKMDTAGNVIFYKETDNTVRDFKRTIVDGTVYYSYLKASTEDASAITASSSQAYVMDENYQIIDVVEYLYTDEGMPEGCLLDDHEFVVLGEGHYLIDSYVYQTVDNVPTDISEDGSAYVQAAVVQEIKDGALIFQWCSTDYPELYEYSVRSHRLGQTDEGTYVDYVHYNAVAVDPSDGNLIFSFRALSALMKVDRDTGEIIWILGGDGDDFALTDEQKMSYQHDPKFLSDGTITVFDNGNDNEQTRAVEYLLDEETLTVLAFNSYQIDGVYSSAKGSAQRVSEDEAIYVMGWGEASADQIIFTEINFDTGEILFQLMNFDCGENYHADSYRVYKYNS